MLNINAAEFVPPAVLSAGSGGSHANGHGASFDFCKGSLGQEGMLQFVPFVVLRLGRKRGCLLCAVAHPVQEQACLTGEVLQWFHRL